MTDCYIQHLTAFGILHWIHGRKGITALTHKECHHPAFKPRNIIHTQEDTSPLYTNQAAKNW